MTHSITILLPLLCLLGVSCASVQPAQNSVNSVNVTNGTTIIYKTVNVYITCTGKDCTTAGVGSGTAASGSGTTASGPGTTVYGSTTTYDSSEDSSEESLTPELVRIGCYRDKWVREFPKYWVFTVNSPAVCVAACKQAGFKYAGPQYTSWCFCGNVLPSEKIADSNCNMKCNGAEVSCGGVMILEVFDTKLEQEDHVDRVGCFRDKGVRQLGNTNWVISANSPAVCIAACRQKGYKYAGPEAGAWCFCGNLIPPEPIPDINCNTKCNGADLFCGGYMALDVYNTGL